MVIFAVIMILAVILLCGLLYVLLSESSGRSKKPVMQGSVRPAIKDSSVRGDDDPGGDHESVLPHGESGDSARTLQTCLTKGMALIFSVEGMPTENKASLLTLDDVDTQVKQTILSLLGALKSFDILHKLQRMIGDPQAAMAELSRMITGDPMLTAKILRVANSPYYGMEQKLNSISHAIMIIGLANLKGIIYSEGIQ